MYMYVSQKYMCFVEHMLTPHMYLNVFFNLLYYLFQCLSAFISCHRDCMLCLNRFTQPSITFYTMAVPLSSHSSSLFKKLSNKTFVSQTLKSRLQIHRPNERVEPKPTGFIIVESMMFFSLCSDILIPEQLFVTPFMREN